MNPTIFISHASEDGGLANLIEEAISARHPGVFKIFNASDETTLLPGTNWKRRIEQAVKNSTLMVVLLTENSNQKPWIYWECGGAFHQRKEILPLLGPDLPISDLQVIFPDIQVAQLLSADHLRKMMRRIDGLARRKSRPDFDPSDLLAKLEHELDKADSNGKDWFEAAKPKLQKFLESIPRGETRTIRMISYTGETSAKKFSRFVLACQKPKTHLEIKVMLRSEYSGFTARPFDIEFNRIIRWRIARAKAHWYRAVSYKKSSTGLTVGIRDYGWDPSPKFFILGESEGYFGQYWIDGRHTLSYHPNIRAARDWVTKNTDMVYVGPNQPSYLRCQIRWFDRMWDQASERSNEAYRIKRSDALWRLLKAKSDSEAQNVIGSLGRSNAEDYSHVGCLAMPKCASETSEEFVDVIGCVVVEQSTGKALLLCEVHDEADSSEGMGKTNAYLSLIGLSPFIREKSKIGRKGSWSDRLLQRISRASIEWETHNGEFRLFAADFVWVSAEERRLTLSPPEGELAFGLWDVARHVVRREMGKDQQWEDGLHRKLSKHQELIFQKLKLADLARRYMPHPNDRIRPDLIVVLEKKTGMREVQVLKSPQVVKGLLKRILRSGPFHRSNFWTRPQEEVNRLNGVVDKLTDPLDPNSLPKIVHVIGQSPFDLAPSLVKRWLAQVAPSGTIPPTPRTDR